MDEANLPSDGEGLSGGEESSDEEDEESDDDGDEGGQMKSRDPEVSQV